MLFSDRGALKKKVLKNLREFILQHMEDFTDNELCERLGLLPSGLAMRRERNDWTLGDCFDTLECLKLTDVSILIKEGSITYKPFGD